MTMRRREILFLVNSINFLFIMQLEWLMIVGVLLLLCRTHPRPSRRLSLAAVVLLFWRDSSPSHTPALSTAVAYYNEEFPIIPFNVFFSTLLSSFFLLPFSLVAFSPSRRDRWLLVKWNLFGLNGSPFAFCYCTREREMRDPLIYSLPRRRSLMHFSAIIKTSIGEGGRAARDAEEEEFKTTLINFLKISSLGRGGSSSSIDDNDVNDIDTIKSRQRANIFQERASELQTAESRLNNSAQVPRPEAHLLNWKTSFVVIMFPH